MSISAANEVAFKVEPGQHRLHNLYVVLINE